MDRERLLHTDTVRNASYREGFRDTAVASCNHGAFKDLDSVLFAFFDAEAARGLPMILLIHIPIYTEGVFAMLRDEEKADSFSLCAIPEHLYSSVGRCAPTNAVTKEFVRRLKSEPLLKAVLAGHIHAHRNHMDELASNLPQLVAGGGYYGCGEIIEFI